jgi:glutathione synthetase
MLYPPEIPVKREKLILRAIQDWSLAHGLVILSGEATGGGIPAPVTIYPTPFPKHGFDEALEVQKPFHDLYHAVCKNEEWLVQELTELAKYDPEFTGRLLDLHLKVLRTGISQHLTGGLFRSDYIVNSIGNNHQIKQVEFNTVSVSFGGLSTRLSELHNYLIESDTYGIAFDKGTVPISPALSQLADGLAKMHQSYVTNVSSTEFAAVLFVVQPGEKNALDQRLLEFELFNKYKIISYRLTLAEIEGHVRKTGNWNILEYIPTGAHISVVYYRSGYTPSDYPSNVEWDARLFLETSHAIKCPSVWTQLSGAKKIQQLLTDEKIIKRLAPEMSESDVIKLKATFTDMYPLDDSSRGLEGRRLAFEQPEKYVLKPQREGGGNNIYRDNIPPFLNSIPKENWGGYVLMELIQPAEIRNKILRAGEVYSGEIISELGVFGSVIWDIKEKTSLVNDVSGWLLRTKLKSSDEGGVAAGFGCIDSVYLY